MGEPARIEPMSGYTPEFRQVICPGCKKPHTLMAPKTLCFECWRRGATGDDGSDNARELEQSIPVRFRDALFMTPEIDARVKDPIALGKARASVNVRNVLLVGHAGAGKTTIGCAMLRAWQTATKGRARFMSVIDLAASRGHHALGDGEAQLVEIASAVPLLLLDDLGAEPATPSRGEIADVIHKRHNGNLATWITTGLTRDMLAKRYGDGVSRRILEGTCVLKVGGAK